MGCCLWSPAARSGASGCVCGDAASHRAASWAPGPPPRGLRSHPPPAESLRAPGPESGPAAGAAAPSMSECAASRAGGQDRARRSWCRGPSRELARSRSPRSIGRRAGRRGCWGHWRRRGLHIWRPGRARPAHRPPAAASCGASWARWRRWQGRRWCSQEGGRGVAPSAGGGVLCGAPRPQTPPLREDAQTGRARGAGRRAGRPRGGRGRGGRSPPTPARLPGLGPPRTGGDGSVSRLALCAAPARRPRRRPGGFVLARLGKRRGSQPGRPLPGSPAAAAAAATAGFRRRRRLLGLRPGRAASFLLAPWLRRRRRLAEPRRRVDESVGAGAPGPAGDPAGGAAGSGASSFSLGVAAAARPDGRGWGGGGAAVGPQAVSHGSPPPRRTLALSFQAATPAFADPHPGWRRAALPGRGRGSCAPLKTPRGALTSAPRPRRRKAGRREGLESGPAAGRRTAALLDTIQDSRLGEEIWVARGACGCSWAAYPARRCCCAGGQPGTSDGAGPETRLGQGRQAGRFGPLTVCISPLTEMARS